MTTIGIDARAASEEPAGRGRVVRELIHAFGRSDGHDRFVLYAREPLDAELDERFSWHCRGLPDPFWHLWAATAASRACDVFLSTNSYLTPWFLRIPSAVIVYDLVAFQPGAAAQRRAARIERLTISRGLKRSRAVICISESTRHDLVTRFPGVEERSTVVPLAADPKFARSHSQQELDAVRQRYGLDGPFVLTVGTLEPRKNLLRVIDAHAGLPSPLREGHPLVLVGPRGWESEEILAGAGEGVRILGHVPDEDLAALYAACTAFCYPALYEGFGLPLLEAMAAGAACVTSNVSSLPEVGGDAVLYADPHSVDEIRDRIETLLTSEEKRTELGGKASSRAAGFSSGPDGCEHPRNDARPHTAMTRPRSALLLVLASGALAGAAPAPAPSNAKPRILVFTKTAGFRHASIPVALQAIHQLASRSGLTVVATEDSTTFSSANLARYDAVVFLLTSGDVLAADQEAALRGFIRKGGGFAGIHSAADTEAGWAWYRGLLGASFKSHPEIQRAEIAVGDRRHPSTVGLPRRWSRTDEWYNFARSPSGSVHVLAALDETSYTPGPDAMGADHPIAWSHTYQGGRAWYTAGGHTDESYAEPRFRRHLLNGIRWAAGLTPPRIVSVTPTLRGRQLVVSFRYASCRPCAAELVVRVEHLVRHYRGPVAGGSGRMPGPALPHGRWQFSLALEDPLTGLKQVATRRVRVS